jgi:hypothetical protein
LRSCAGRQEKEADRESAPAGCGATAGATERELWDAFGFAPRRHESSQQNYPRLKGLIRHTRPGLRHTQNPPGDGCEIAASAGSGLRSKFIERQPGPGAALREPATDFDLKGRIVTAPNGGRFAMSTRLGQPLVGQNEFLAPSQLGELRCEGECHAGQVDDSRPDFKRGACRSVGLLGLPDRQSA